MVKVDLRSDVARARRFIERRVRRYPKYVNIGPGADEDPIAQIVLGYYVADAAYISLIFDTRPDADSDGAWTLFLQDETVLMFPKWVAAGDALCDGKAVELTTLRGAKKVLVGDEGCDELVALIGKMLADLMKKLRREKLFDALPLRDDAFMLVEDFGGDGGWPESYDVIKTEGRIKPLRSKTSSKRPSAARRSASAARR
ncbi:MAG: hypothetical protein H6730_17515 [Deltaproteobacteria bacterium]|nr:hypothetical protein [Deltaproteobacteria bacterium]